MFNLIKNDNIICKDVLKISEITDINGLIRFKVVFSNFDFFEETYEQTNMYYTWLLNQTWHTDYKYQVVVLGFNDLTSDVPTILSARDFIDYDIALREFNKQCDVYTQLVKAETKGWQDIRLYKSKINCHKIDPDCCANCEFVRKEKNKKHHQHFKFDQNDTLFCAHPDVLSLNTVIDQHDRKEYSAKSHTEYEIGMCPITFNYFICDNYKRRK